jgi:translation initiation factor eIF-2B subunit beta
MDVVTLNGKYLVKMLPLQTCIGNIVRRVLQIIREEYTSELKNETDETQESLHKILTAENNQQIDFNVSKPFLKASLIDHINEFEAELETW